MTSGLGGLWKKELGPSVIIFSMGIHNELFQYMGGLPHLLNHQVSMRIVLYFTALFSQHQTTIFHRFSQEYIKMSWLQYVVKENPLKSHSQTDNTSDIPGDGLAYSSRKLKTKQAMDFVFIHCTSFARLQYQVF